MSDGFKARGAVVALGVRHLVPSDSSQHRPGVPFTCGMSLVWFLLGCFLNWYFAVACYHHSIAHNTLWFESIVDASVVILWVW